MPRASSLAAAIEESTGNEVTLIGGDDGIFDVHVDGRLAFSKHAEGRYPDPEEILAQLP